MTRDAGGTREPGRRWDPKFFPILKNEKCFSKLDNFIVFSVLCVSLL